MELSRRQLILALAGIGATVVIVLALVFGLPRPAPSDLTIVPSPTPTIVAQQDTPPSQVLFTPVPTFPLVPSSTPQLLSPVPNSSRVKFTDMEGTGTCRTFLREVIGVNLKKADEKGTYCFTSADTNLAFNVKADPGSGKCMVNFWPNTQDVQITSIENGEERLLAPNFTVEAHTSKVLTVLECTLTLTYNTKLWHYSNPY